jgi:toxin HigB-1
VGAASRALHHRGSGDDGGRHHLEFRTEPHQCHRGSTLTKPILSLSWQDAGSGIFAFSVTALLHARQHVKRFRGFERVAQRKLRQLDIAAELRDLASPPGNRLETLKGDREGQHSIRINDQ